MKKWVAILFLVISVSAFATDIGNDKNDDRIGTFLGGDDPFPWDRQVDLPEDLSGIWEVQDSPDGAYFIITREGTEQKPKTFVHLFDPCTFELSAAGEAFEQDQALYSTVGYSKDRSLERRLIFKAYETKYASSSPQVVLMVMNKDKSSKVDKYFPVNKVSVSDVQYKCEDTKRKRAR